MTWSSSTQFVCGLQIESSVLLQYHGRDFQIICIGIKKILVLKYLSALFHFFFFVTKARVKTIQR